MHNIPKQKQPTKDNNTNKVLKAQIEKYRKLSGLVLQKKISHDYSSTALSLAQALILINPDVYFAWNYRKEAFLHFLNKSTRNFKNSNDKSTEEILDGEHGEIMADFSMGELELTQKALMINPKSYSAWFHRKWIINQNKLSEKVLQNEINLIDEYLDFDCRNFHCWTYRRFIVKKLKIPFETEFEFTAKKLKQNFSNYSAWHYRSILIEFAALNSLPKNDTIFSHKNFIINELKFIYSALYTEPNDISAWLFYLWLLARQVGANSFFEFLKNAKNYQKMVKNSQNLTENNEILIKKFKKCEKLFEEEFSKCVALKKEEPSGRWIGLALIFLKSAFDSNFGDEITKITISDLKEKDVLRIQFYQFLEFFVN